MSLAIFSSPSLSLPSKPWRARQSKSRTPTVSPLLRMRGRTISLFVSLSQAIWPGYSSTFGTKMVCPWRKASAHTPWLFPGIILMNWQAGFPENGPSNMRSEILITFSEFLGMGKYDDSIYTPNVSVWDVQQWVYRVVECYEATYHTN